MFQPWGGHLVYDWTKLLSLLFIFSISFPHCFAQDLDYHILQLQASLDVHAHTPLTLWVSTSCIVPMAMNVWEHMMQFTTFLLLLCEMQVFTWDENNYMCFLQPCLTPFAHESTLCSPKMVFAPQLMLLSTTQCMWIYFSDLAQLKNLLLSIQLKPKK